jgi:hypothetical protein
MKNKVEDCKKLRNKNITTSFTLNEEILIKAKNKRVIFKKQFLTK